MNAPSWYDKKGRQASDCLKSSAREKHHTILKRYLHLCETMLIKHRLKMPQMESGRAGPTLLRSSKVLRCSMSHKGTSVHLPVTVPLAAGSPLQANTPHQSPTSPNSLIACYICKPFQSSLFQQPLTPHFNCEAAQDLFSANTKVQALIGCNVLQKCRMA